MSRWDRSVTETVDDATRFWAEASRQTLEDMMAPRWAWEAWLRVAAGVIVSPGSIANSVFASSVGRVAADT